MGNGIIAPTERCCYDLNQQLEASVPGETTPSCQELGPLEPFQILFLMQFNTINNNHIMCILFWRSDIWPLFL